MSGNEMVEMIRSVFEWAALLIEVLGAGIIVAGRTSLEGAQA